MKYSIDADGRMTCERAGICGSCRVNEHGLYNLLPGDSLVDAEGNILCTGCGKAAESYPESEQLKVHGIHEECRPQQVARIAARFGSFDGAHHKQWVIDQMLQASLGKEKYQKWVEEMNSDTDYDPWDTGRAP